MKSRLLLLDIGNTHCHVGSATVERLLKHADLPTPALLAGRDGAVIDRVLERTKPVGAVLCSVVPAATVKALGFIRERFGLSTLELTHRTLRGVGLDYPKPATIGPDRLANAIAARHFFGSPAVV